MKKTIDKANEQFFDHVSIIKYVNALQQWYVNKCHFSNLW